MTSAMKPGDDVTHHDRRPGIADGDAAAHEQAGADRAAEADHHDLGAGEALCRPCSRSAICVTG